MRGKLFKAREGALINPIVVPSVGIFDSPTTDGLINQQWQKYVTWALDDFSSQLSNDEQFQLLINRLILGQWCVTTPTSNMIKISDNVPVGSNVFIDITLPSSGYREFLIRSYGGTSGSFQRLFIRFNGDTTNSNYPGVNQAGTAISNRAYLVGVKTSDQESIGELRIFNPHSTTVRKSFWAKSGLSNDYLDCVGAWLNTSALTDVRLTSSGATVVSGFRAELWGLVV